MSGIATKELENRDDVQIGHQNEATCATPFPATEDVKKAQVFIVEIGLFALDTDAENVATRIAMEGSFAMALAEAGKVFTGL